MFVNCTFELNTLYPVGKDRNAHACSDQSNDSGRLQHFSCDARPKSRVRANVEDLPIKACSGLARIHDERFALELARRQGWSSRQGMILLNSDNEGGAIPLADLYSSGNPHLRLAQNPDIQGSLQQAMELLERRNIMKRERHRGTAVGTGRSRLAER